MNYVSSNFLDWFDLSVYYDLSSVQIHEALYKFGLQSSDSEYL